MRQAGKEFIKTYEALETGGYVRIMDIINRTDIDPADLQDIVKGLYRGGWDIIPNSQGGDVTAEERKYCPRVGGRQVHLIRK